jgi:hypothetical protein
LPLDGASFDDGCFCTSISTCGLATGCEPVVP